MSGPRTTLCALLVVALVSPCIALASASSTSRQVESAIDALLASDPYLPPAPQVLELLAGSDAKACAELARGIALLEKGDFESARLALVAASELNPNSPCPHYYLGELALRRGDHTAAIAALRSAVAVRRDFAGAHALLGQAYVASGDTQRGLVCFRTAIAFAPGRARGHLDLGRAQLDAGQPEHAQIAFVRVLELLPQCLEARYLLARSQINSGDPSAGFASLRDYVRDAAGVPEEGERVARAREILRQSPSNS
jgi:tetratricopeptide (TPR) repeat protein